VTLDAYYTVRKQFKVSCLPELYIDADRVVLSGGVEYGRIVDKFWGVGPQTEDYDGAEYVKGIFRIQARGLVLIIGSLRGGLLWEFERQWIIDKKENQLLRQASLSGSDGGTSSGGGVTASWDTRDNIYFPSCGSFHQFEHAVFSPGVGSDYSFHRTVLDLRVYMDLGRKHIIAVQGGGMIAGGDPPFYRLAPLGGENIMRGYYTGRFRDFILIAAQAEYRTMVWKRIGVVAFLGAGDVAHRLSAFRLPSLKPSYGAGLRFLLDPEEQLTIRFDAGFGTGTDGIYLGVREAF
jgi:outer membrane protein assembly factor BamA